MITNEQFNKIWSLHKVGSPDNTKNILDYQIKQEETYNGVLVDFDYIYNKYVEYKKWWTHMYGGRDPKYVGEKNEMKSVNDFIKSNMFKMDYEIDKTSADYYLGLSLVDKKVLMDELNEFLK